MLLAVPLAPLAGSVLAGIFGTAFGGNKFGRGVSHSLTILGVLVSFILSALTFQAVVSEGARFDQTIYEWMVVGGLKMEVGFLIDSITAMMMCVVTFVSLMVHIYTMGYMEEDDGYNRFFSYISLFTFSMLMLVMSNNLLQLFFGWEAVGLVSYLLIGFYFKKESAIFANMKAFLVNRVGDFGFILGIGLIAAYTGTLVMVSHDRAFIEGLADRIWLLEDGQFHEYPGWADYREKHPQKMMPGEAQVPSGEEIGEAFENFLAAIDDRDRGKTLGPGSMWEDDQIDLPKDPDDDE